MTNHEGSPLLIATNNKGKVKEIQDLLKGMDIELVTPSQIGLELDVVEDGKTYTENATKKAIAFAQASNLISLADDSGLEVDALDGAPGLYSARYGSSHSLPQNSQNLGGVGGGSLLSFSDRRKYLISNLQGKPRPWTARFRATIAIANPSNVKLNPVSNESLQLTEGTCEGEIIPEDRGTGGFGYDPIFLFPELGKTMAELPAEEKNRLSHRAKAVMNAKGILEEMFRQ